MRKISKSRADDEAISSTNGSVTNEVEDQPDVEKPAETKDEDSQPETNENGGNEDAELSDDADKDKPGKKRKSRSKSKGKKKSTKKAKKGDDAAEDDDEAEEEKEEEYEVEKIVDSKKIKGKLHYLIRWKGYGADTDTWEPESTVSCPNLVTKFNEEQKKNKKEEGDSPKKSPKKGKGKASKEPKTPAKKPKSEWDSENADKNEEYEVDRILEVHHKKNGKREFLIHWKGWSTKFDSWEPENHLNCKDLIKKFMEKVESAKSTESRSLRVAPETTNRFTLQAPSSGRRLSKRRGQSQRVRYDDAE